MTGKPAITDYDVQYKQQSDSTWTIPQLHGNGHVDHPDRAWKADAATTSR